ncbi:hypothetical protein IJG04_00005, partial [Candidatus Saccharibacteria bacterium]|nr:hypothetical protein [Candidatus Saccharibacteria bacterium]
NTTIDNTDTTTGLFFPAPTVSGFTIARTTTANGSTTSTASSNANNYTFSLGARADYTQIAGTYTNTYVLQAVGNAITYNITYSDNTGDSSVANLPYFNGNTANHTQAGSVSTTSITLRGSGTNNTDDATPTRTGYTFTGWCNTTTTESGTLCNGSTTPTYVIDGTALGGITENKAYGIDQTTTNDATLYATWVPIDYTITVTSGAGISTLSATGWTNTGTATISKIYHIGDTIDLSSIITPTYKTGYNGTSYTKDSSDTAGSITNSTYTVGAGNGSITIKATGLDTPVCTMTGGATKVYNRSATTLTATDNSANYDTDSVDITYSFGYATNGTNDLGDFSSAGTNNTISITKNAYRGARYYGVTVVVTDKTDSSITNTCTSGTVDSAVTGTNVGNRTTMTLVNSRINFDATTNGGTLNGTSPVYVYYGGTATYSSRTGTTARAIPTATPPSGYAFDGWYTSASGGSKVINADGTLTGVAVSGWTNTSKQWVKTGTSNSATATANQLYAQYVIQTSCASTTFSGYMQDMSVSTVANACVGDTGTLTDRRDSKTYTVAKLLDGNLWMTSNLDLAGGTTLNASDSNVPIDNYYTLEPSSLEDIESVYSTAVYNSGSTDCSSYCYSYYGWAAATAGGRDNSGNKATRYHNATYSICPKGWRLPTTTTSDANPTEGSNWKTGDWYTLASAYGANLASTSYDNSTDTGGIFYSNAGPNTTPNFLISGGFVNYLTYDEPFETTAGTYWSSTSYSSPKNTNDSIYDTLGYSGSLTSKGVWTANGGFGDTLERAKQGAGKSVRCIFDNDGLPSRQAITFQLDSHIASIVIGEKVITNNETVLLYSETGYNIKVNATDGYMPNTMSVVSGDATISDAKITIGNNNSIISITSQAQKSVSVEFAFPDGIASVTVDGQTINNSGDSASLLGGNTYTVSVTTASQADVFAGASIESGSWYTIVNSKDSEFNLTVGIDNGAITIEKDSSNTNCITADTLITLADGDKKRVADLTGDEELLVWDFDIASYSSAPIVFIELEPEDDYRIIHLFFDDQTDVEISYEHGFFDYTLGKFIYVNENNPEQYIGHRFIMQDGDSYKTVVLTDIKHETKHTTLYGLTTYKQFNFFNNDMLSIGGNITGMFNYFDVDLNTMGYDQEKKQADIAKYGLLTYEDFQGVIDEFGFEAYNGQYLNVSIGKGLTTWEKIKALADYYGHFTAQR